MLPGRTLQSLAAEIKRQQSAKVDYLADTNAIRMTDSGNLMLDGHAPFIMTGNAHSQLGEYLNIPAKYYAKMHEECPELLVANVNRWLELDGGKDRRMIRTLDGQARAFLSDRYRRIDNYEVAETVLPIIGGMSGAQVVSCEITDTKMYIKVVNPRVYENVRVGDIVQSGMIISNSEVGRGSVSISPLVYRLVCTNGMIANDASAVRKNHIGRAGESDIDYSILRDDTIEADDRAFMLKIRDAVAAAADPETFRRIVDKMRDAAESPIEAATVPKVVELASKQFGITQSESEGVLGHLIEGGDLSLYGMANAVTRYAQDIESYDRSTELEATGYKVLTMSPALWHTMLATAKKEM